MDTVTCVQTVSQTKPGSLLAYHPQEYSPPAILQRSPLRLVFLHTRSILSFASQAPFPLRAVVSGASLLPSGHHAPCKSAWGLLGHAARLLQVPPWLPVNSPPPLGTGSVQLLSRLWVSRGRRLCLHTPRRSALPQLRHLRRTSRLAALKLHLENKGQVPSAPTSSQMN